MNGASEFSDSKYLIVWVSFQSKKAPKKTSFVITISNVSKLYTVMRFLISLPLNSNDSSFNWAKEAVSIKHSCSFLHCKVYSKKLTFE